MDLKFSKIASRDKKAVEMFLYGDLGESSGEINGHWFAQELDYLSSYYDEITIRVNCNGGLVSHGLSIVSVMMKSSSFITAVVDGIAASMGAVILTAADRVKINDYGKIMVHSPYYMDENGNAIDKLSQKEKKALSVIKDTLSSLLEKRGIEKAAIDTMMKTDSWFTADEALAAKLVDEVITTGKKKEYAVLEPLRLAAKIKSENFENDTIKMKEVIAKLGLPENSDEQAVVAAIGQLQAKEPEKVNNPKLIEKLLEAGKKAGVVTDKNEASFKALAEKDVDLFVDMLNLDNLKPVDAAPKDPAKEPEAKPKADNTRLSDVIKVLQGENKPEAKKWADYSQAELEELEEKEPGKYEKLFIAHFGVELKKCK